MVFVRYIRQSLYLLVIISYQYTLMASILTTKTLFSNTRHEFDWESMIKFPSGLTWVHGELDLKFGKIHQKIKSERPQDQLISIPDRGHRLLGPQSQTWLSQIF